MVQDARRGPRSPARWTWWAIIAGAALLSASQWLHAPSVEYLVPLIIATAVALAFATRIVGAQRWWAISASALLAIAVALALPAQRALWQVSHDWDGWRHRSTVGGLAVLRTALDDALRTSTATARRALEASTDRSQAFADLSHLTHGPDEHGVAVFHGDTAVAWAGTIHPNIDWHREGTSVVATSFYLALQVTVRRDDTRAAAVALLFAEPPADRLSSPLSRRVATETGLNGFAFALPTDSSNSAEVLHYALGNHRLFDVRAAPLGQDEIKERIKEQVRARAGIAFLLALACFIIGVWRGTRALSQRVAALAVGLACTALVPLNQYSNLTRLFDPAVYFTPKGGPLTGNAGALATTSAIVLLGILAVFRRQARRVSRPGAIATILLVAGLGPFLLRELARGVQIPVHGVDSWLWLIWEVPLFLAAVSVLLAGAAAGSAALGPRRGLSPWVAPFAATLAAVLATEVWQAPGRWPWWYAFLWIGAIAMLALTRRSRFVILSASTVAALGATTLVWGRTAKGRVDASERDLAGLSRVDSVSVMLLRRLGESLREDFAPVTREALLQQYVASDIAAAGNPVALFAWPSDSGPVAWFATARFSIPEAEITNLVAVSRRTRALIVEPVATDSAVELVMAAPSVNGVTAVVIAPKTRLFDTDPFARLIGLDVNADVEPPYTVRLRERNPNDVARVGLSWQRRGSELHGDGIARTGAVATPVHVEVELRSRDALIERGALLVMLDLALVGVLWMASVVADGGAGRWLRARRRTWGRSYRARLSIALFGFFVVPAIVFAVWSYGQLATDATQSRALLVSETLRALEPPSPAPLWLPAESQRLYNTPLFLYQNGELRDASDPLYAELAPVGRYLAPSVELNLAVGDEETSTLLQHIDGVATLFGYRGFPQSDAPFAVIAAPARADELTLGRRRRDLGVLVLFATAVGAIAALWLSGLAGRQLARPIGLLREAALSIAGGARTPPLETEPMVEFNPVFSAFRRMASDLHASRSALEEAQRQTAAVLRNVASGVVAVDANAFVSLANPRAEALLGTPLPPGTPFGDHAPAPIVEIVARFLASDGDEKAFESAVDQQQLRGTLTRLARGGAVVTVDDVTELARAQRVLAWGEMARQVAHEIKNPLTPIRLGVQHLRRARADSRIDFDRVLEHNVNQILTEIDRLDEIARAFSRYGAAPEERQRATPIDIAAIVREVVSLERMGEQSAGGLDWQEHGVDAPIFALARPDELKEVLLNVLENARLADANRVAVSVDCTTADDGTRRVTITVRDNGRGIPPDILPRIFEPHFSTRTSGSGLGLAISRQIVEGWGGTISVESRDSEGANVMISLAADSVR